MNTSSLIALANGVRAYFVANGITAIVAPVGWRERAKITNQGPGGASRVCFIPGDFDASGAPKASRGGALVSPKHTHLNPRQLLGWDRACTVSVWGVDPAALSDEQAQIAATETLLELTIRAMHSAVDPDTQKNVGLADIRWGEATWTIPPLEQSFGREVLVSFVHRATFFDATIERTTPKPAVARNPSE